MELLSTILQTIRTECSMLCMTKPTPSVLRVTSLKKFSSFKWEDVDIELQQKAPTLFAILKAAAQPTRSRQATPLTSMIAIAAGILLKSCNKHMCLLQSIVATVLFASHASTKVTNWKVISIQQFYNHMYSYPCCCCCMKSGASQYFICIRFAPVLETPFHTLLQVYARLAKLGVSVSHMTATRLIRKLGQSHNRKVLQWKAQCSGTQRQGQSGSETWKEKM